ncbi:MAG: GNAT family N-acetyltransferase, partial [Flavobacteriales bacterium]|nr:GNAT family N-acetyltransferase [Flavobacteriales bacterium]
MRITLRAIDQANFRDCIDLKVSPDQEPFVAPNVFSLAQAKANPLLTPLAIYDGSICGHEPGENDPMVGFLMYQIMDGVGFVVRMMIGSPYQKRGYGRAAMVEVIRRFKLMPEIEYIGTS